MLKKFFCIVLSFLIATSVVFVSGCKEKFTVRFYANGGTLVSGEEVQTVSSASEIVPPVYEKEGYVLSFDKIIADITEDTEVYAVWTPISYRLSFDGNGGSFYNQTISISLNEKLPTLPVPVKEGYIFVGWYVGETLITDGYKWNFKENKTAKARYEESGDDKYSILYDLDGGVLENIKTFYSSQEGDFSLGTPNKEGYEFIGWREENETEIKNPTIITQGTVGNKKFYANYTAITYKVSFNSDGGNQISNVLDVVFDQTLASLPIPKKSGNVFAGWYVDETMIVSGQKWTIPKNATLIAKWVIDDGKTFSITYDLDGGEINNPRGYYVEGEEDFYLPTPYKKGFIFKGYVKDGETEAVNPVTIKKGTTGNLKFTAKWEMHITIRFELSRNILRYYKGTTFYETGYCTVNGKSFVDDVHLTIGQTLSLPTPTLANKEDDQFSYDQQKKAYKYWIIDVKNIDELEGKETLDSTGVVIYSGDVFTEELAKYAVNGIITIRPRIITLHYS